MSRLLTIIWLGLALGLSACAGPSATFRNDASRGEAAALQPHSDIRTRVVEQATSLLGVPYRYGGVSPTGFDCSGFVRYVFHRAADISLPRRAVDQIKAGTRASRGAMQPGDLVYFRIEKQRSPHVGIYLGKGRFIHAPSRGGVVNVQSLGQPYWRARFLGARSLVL